MDITTDHDKGQGFAGLDMAREEVTDRERRLPIGSEALTSDDEGRIVRVTVVRHGRDSMGIYTEVRGTLGKSWRVHRSQLHPISAARRETRSQK